ncbi:MAG TPA: hypothetical protein VG245_11630 [Candidatus Dormibacteraeota bacterium]|jgi:hypothetical protein|nr:hypothetical protein [Candidatus Dormibacteraeota bacterium]
MSHRSPRLSLRPETIRELTPSQLDGAAGGLPPVSETCRPTFGCQVPTLFQPCVINSGPVCLVLTTTRP